MQCFPQLPDTGWVFVHRANWLSRRQSLQLKSISQISRSLLFSAGTRSSAAENVVEGDGAGAEEDQSKSQRGYRQRELHSVIAGQSIVQVHFPDRDAEVHADGESRDPGKESRQYEQAAEEFREGRNVAQPVGKTKTCYEVGVVMQASENFVVAMHDHNGAQGEPHEKKRKWLQAFRVAQGGLRVRHQITADQITAEKWCGVKTDQQNDCVAAQLLVTFFRPLSETCKSHQSATGLGVMSARVAARLRWKVFVLGWHVDTFCEGGPPPPVREASVT
jgi:hypothetical protein